MEREVKNTFLLVQCYSHLAPCSLCWTRSIAFHDFNSVLTGIRKLLLYFSISLSIWKWLRSAGPVLQREDLCHDVAVLLNFIFSLLFNLFLWSHARLHGSDKVWVEIYFRMFRSDVINFEIVFFSFAGSWDLYSVWSTWEIWSLRARSISLSTIPLPVQC